MDQELYIRNKARQIVKALGVAGVVWDTIVWCTIGLSLAYIGWLAALGDILEPVRVHGSTINLDLLQTLAFLVAVTALEGVVVAAFINKLKSLKTEIDLASIRNIGTISEPRSSRLKRVINHGTWIWGLVHVAFSIMVLRQGLLQACLPHRETGPSSIELGGSLAIACFASWIVVVLVASALSVSFYQELRHWSVVLIAWAESKRDQNNT